MPIAKQHDRADLEEGREIVPGRQQQPHRQHRGDEAVADDGQRQRRAGEIEIGRQRRILGHRTAEDQRQQQQDRADRRHLADAPRPDETRIEAHDQRDRNRAEHREGAPRAAHQRLHHDEGEHGEDDDADQQHAEAGDASGDGAHLGAHHVAERTAVAPRGKEQHGHVLHRAGEHDAGENPQRARQIAHLRGEDGPDQRAGAGDRREMVAEQHVAVGRHVIEAVVAPIGRRLPRRVDPERAVGDEEAVEAIGDGVDADRGDDQPGGVHRLPARQRHDREGNRANHRHRGPRQLRLQRHGPTPPPESSRAASALRSLSSGRPCRADRAASYTVGLSMQ